MADKLRLLLKAYYDDLVIRQASDLSDFQSYFLTEQPLPQDFSADLPCVLIWGQTVEQEPVCLGYPSYTKEYDITLTVVAESYDDGYLGVIGDAYTPGVIDLANTLEDAYLSETFSLSQGCVMRPPMYSNRPLPPMDGTCYATLTFKHYHKDMRGENMYDYIMYPSGIITLDGTESCPVGYKTIRVQSDGGSVLMSALPNFAQPADDCRMFIVQGMSDTNYVTFRDASNLPGSGLHLKNARDMTLGKNDILGLLYNDIDGICVELFRSDTY